MKYFLDKLTRKLKVSGTGNHVSYIKNEKGRFYISGENNLVDIRGKTKNVHIRINGNNNKIIVEENCALHHVKFHIGMSSSKVNNATIYIGKNTRNTRECDFCILEDNSKILLGEDCLLADGIYIWCTDGHTILDKNKQITNEGCSVEIGNHVWIAKDVKINKNTSIADGSVVGWNSTVTKKFTQPNVVIAGNPAKIVKTDIEWNGASVRDYKLQHPF